MVKQEFENIIKAFKIKRVIHEQLVGIEIYDLNDINIYFHANNYAVIVGKIPYIVCQRIYERYPANPYNVNIHGYSGVKDPFDYATNSEYEKFVKSAVQYLENNKNYKENLAKLTRSKKEQILLNNPESLYIINYCIKNKLGLLIFLNELNNYYSSIKNENAVKIKTK